MRARDGLQLVLRNGKGQGMTAQQIRDILVRDYGYSPREVAGLSWPQLSAELRAQDSDDDLMPERM